MFLKLFFMYVCGLMFVLFYLMEEFNFLGVEYFSF